MTFAVQGYSKETIKAFSAILEAHSGTPGNVVEVVCDTSQALLSGTADHRFDARVMVDWCNIVQIFTKVLDDVRKLERRERAHTKALRWRMLKSMDNDNLT